MADITADRNLLFGVLALQTGFITRDQLVAGMRAWAEAKNRSLGEIFVEQNIFRPDVREVLERLVDKHLELHGNDPAHSVATVSIDRTVSGKFASAERSSVDDWLVQVGLIAGPEGSKPTSSDAGQSKSPDARYVVLRPHAEGGLGRVSVAMDRELRREVAFKELQPRRAHDAQSRSRFTLEAEITGRLEHPGIVPVYGMGCYRDGRPFYAMRFIRGISLKRAIDDYHQRDRVESTPESGAAPTTDIASSIDDPSEANLSGDSSSRTRRRRTKQRERSLELRKLLRRLIDVCNALEYAHSRGILHRDIKPGNIMLGKYGETLIVDWGLAKVMGQTDDRALPSDEGLLEPESASGSAPTVVGVAVGTPSYMSPEQAAGRVDALSPASDVYGIGATMYYLLTGRHPVTGADMATTLRRVQQGDFSRPRQIAHWIPASLEAICLKAMAVQPSDRYQRAVDMADDLERWLADETISARRESSLASARRWIRKHQTFAAALATLVLVSIVGLGSLASTVYQRNADLEAVAEWFGSENVRLQMFYEREYTSRLHAMSLERAAREQTRWTQSLLAFLLVQPPEDLPHQPSAAERQPALVNASPARLREVATLLVSTTENNHYTWRALSEMGHFFADLASGTDAFTSNRGTYHPLGEQRRAANHLALVFFEQARQTAAQLAAKDPEVAQWRRNLMQSNIDLAMVHRNAGDIEQSAKALADARGVEAPITRSEQGPLEFDPLAQALAVEQERLDLASLAYGPWDTLLAQPAEEIPELLLLRGGEAIRAGNARGAVEAIAKLDGQNVNPDQWYRAACIYSQCAASLADNQAPDDSAEPRGSWKNAAIEALQKAIDGGWDDFERLRSDPDLVPLRDSLEFQSLLPAN